MPGKQGNSHWFREIFGFRESDAGSFQNVRSKFEFNEETGVLISLENKRSFNVGQFETPSTAELRSRLDGNIGDGDLGRGGDGDPGRGADGDLGGLTFKNISDNATTLHMDRRNEGSVFQVVHCCQCWCSVISNVSGGLPVQLFGDGGPGNQARRWSHQV